MSADVLNTTKREKLGKRNNKRLRAAGNIPAVIYGHGGESVSLSVVADELMTALRRGAKLVDLKGGVTDSALVSAVQWSAMGTEILHIDLTRVKKGERVETSVKIVLRGNAPGVNAGGSVDHQLHKVDLDCEVTAIPDKLDANINSLELNQAITAGDLELPPGTKLLIDPTTVVVQCVEKTEAAAEEEAGPSDGAEPEVIGRKAEDGEGEGESKGDE